MSQPDSQPLAPKLNRRRFQFTLWSLLMGWHWIHGASQGHLAGNQTAYRG